MKTINNKLPAFELDKLVEFTPENEPIKEDVRRQIATIISNDIGVKDAIPTLTFDIDCNAPNHGPMTMGDATMDWRPITKLGKLTKRLQKFCWVKHKKKLKNDTMEKLGNLINANIIKPKTYCIDVTRTLDWGRGWFGDGDACFTGDNRPGTKFGEMQKDPNWSALRIFQASLNTSAPGYSRYYDGYYGVGRSLLLKVKVETRPKSDVKVETEVLLVMNGYGPTSFQQTSLMAAYVGLPFKPIRIKNSERLYGGFYANGDMGYVIGDPKVLEGATTIDVSGKIK
jgi:hypothetical protein